MANISLWNGHDGPEHLSTKADGQINATTQSSDVPIALPWTALSTVTLYYPPLPC